MSYFRAFLPRPRAEQRLVCFPHAGGSASTFRGWAGLLPDSVELVAVQYPGRQDRQRDPLPASIPLLAKEIAEAIGPWLDRPTAFFGHSMGAVVAFEVARQLQPRFPPPLARLIVSASNAPATCLPRGLDLRDQQIRDYVRGLGGTPAAPLDDDELWQVVYPVVRDDLRLTETYRYVPGAPLTMPITAIAGTRDHYVTSADVEGWSAYTIAGFDAHVLPGGHFYFEDALGELLPLLSKASATTRN